MLHIVHCFLFSSAFGFHYRIEAGLSRTQFINGSVSNKAIHFGCASLFLSLSLFLNQLIEKYWSYEKRNAHISANKPFVRGDVENASLHLLSLPHPPSPWRVDVIAISGKTCRSITHVTTFIVPVVCICTHVCIVVYTLIEYILGEAGRHLRS